MQKNEQLNESVEDVLDLFPDEGELFSMSENERIATPNEKTLPKVSRSNQKNPSPIAFEDMRDKTITFIPNRSDEKLSHSTKLAVTARLGVFSRSQSNIPNLRIFVAFRIRMCL